VCYWQVSLASDLSSSWLYCLWLVHRDVAEDTSLCACIHPVLVCKTSVLANSTTQTMYHVNMLIGTINCIQQEKMSHRVPT